MLEAVGVQTTHTGHALCLSQYAQLPCYANGRAAATAYDTLFNISSQQASKLFSPTRLGQTSTMRCTWPKLTRQQWLQASRGLPQMMMPALGRSHHPRPHTHPATRAGTTLS